VLDLHEFLVPGYQCLGVRFRSKFGSFWRIRSMSANKSQTRKLLENDSQEWCRNMSQLARDLLRPAQFGLVFRTLD